MLDEMAIKKHIQFSGSKTMGYVDMGLGSTDDSNLMASYVLVFMVVALNGH